MTLWAAQRLSGWGRVCSADCLVARPERMTGVGQALEQRAGASVLARGAGRSYGDAALNAAGRLVDMSRLDRILDFDRASGRVIVEGGATFGDLVDVFLPQGYLPPVMPGTGFATLGGGVANDVHGKNHHQAGSLGQQVESIDLRLPNGELRRLEPHDGDALFRATVGGIGLTGIIERVSLRLLAVPSNAVRVRRRRVDNLDEHLSALAQEQARCSHVVGWIDALARGRSLGRGIVEAGEASPDGVPDRGQRALRVPFEWPSGSLNAWTVRCFNSLYWRRVPRGGRESLMHWARFLFPLDALHDWNRIYGRRGFRQFQCVLPFDDGAAGLRRLLELVSHSGHGSFLAVLKTLGPKGVGMMSFAMPGHTLALDFPDARGATELIARLERIALDHGGRTYLAKDSTLTPKLLRAMYPELPAFEAALAEIDPAHCMASDMSRRLALRSAAP